MSHSEWRDLFMSYEAFLSQATKLIELFDSRKLYIQQAFDIMVVKDSSV